MTEILHAVIQVRQDAQSIFDKMKDLFTSNYIKFMVSSLCTFY